MNTEPPELVVELVIINSRKFDGSIRRSWDCVLVESSGTHLVLTGTFDMDVSHPDLGEIKRGTISREYYWLDRWYSIFCFHEPNGVFRNYYCNINMPPIFDKGVLDYVDLDIDVVVWPDGSYKILDEQEYCENSESFSYPDIVRSRVAETLVELVSLIESRQLPVAW